MDLSVIICSYNRYELAENSARAIESSSSFDPNVMEIILVDNTPLKLRRPLSCGPSVRVELCDEQGLSHARNKGILAAQGKLIAFVDDDAIVRDHWCTSLVRAFKEFPSAKACGGRTVPRFSGQAMPPWYYPELNNYLSCIDWGTRAQPLISGQWIVGANMAFRAQVFEECGLFNPALGRSGEASLLSNEETALLKKLKHEFVFYVPDMEAEHIIPDSRLTLSWFRKRVFWQAVSDLLASDVYTPKAELRRSLFDIVSRAPAEHRGHRLYSYSPTGPAEMKDQLDAIYLQTILLANGTSMDSLDG